MNGTNEVPETIDQLNTHVGLLNGLASSTADTMEAFDDAMKGLKSLSKATAMLGVFGAALDIAMTFIDLATGEPSPEEKIMGMIEDVANQITQLGDRIDDAFTKQELINELALVNSRYGKDKVAWETLIQRVNDYRKTQSDLRQAKDQNNQGEIKRLTADAEADEEALIGWWNADEGRHYHEIVTSIAGIIKDKHAELGNKGLLELLYELRFGDLKNIMSVGAIIFQDIMQMSVAFGVIRGIQRKHDIIEHFKSLSDDFILLESGAKSDELHKILGDLLEDQDITDELRDNVADLKKALDNLLENEAMSKELRAKLEEALKHQANSEAKSRWEARTGNDQKFFSGHLEAVNEVIEDYYNKCKDEAPDNIQKKAEFILNNVGSDSAKGDIATYGYANSAVALRDGLTAHFSWLGFAAVVYDPVVGGQFHQWRGLKNSSWERGQHAEFRYKKSGTNYDEVNYFIYWADRSRPSLLAANQPGKGFVDFVYQAINNVVEKNNYQPFDLNYLFAGKDTDPQHLRIGFDDIYVKMYKGAHPDAASANLSTGLTWWVIWAGHPRIGFALSSIHFYRKYANHYLPSESIGSYDFKNWATETTYYLVAFS